jgi:hypothetical protein
VDQNALVLLQIPQLVGFDFVLLLLKIIPRVKAVGESPVSFDDFSLTEEICAFDRSASQLFEAFSDTFVVVDGHDLLLVEFRLPPVESGEHGVKIWRFGKKHLLHLGVIVAQRIQPVLRR